ncbi:MAG: peptidylprolyl isomerase [Pseudomonadota bacterium]
MKPVKTWAACFALFATMPLMASAQDETTEAVITAEMAAADPDTWRQADPENIIIFRTTSGRVVIEMLPEVAPSHATQFRTLVRSGDYDGTSFHRVIQGFMAQGGDIFALKGRESGLPNIPGEFTFRRTPEDMPMDAFGEPDISMDGYIKGFPIKTQAAWIAEMSSDGLIESYIPHCASVVSTARTSDPDSANSQFFLMRGRAEHLDRGYTAWGRIIDGQDAVMSIKLGEPPAVPDILQRAVMAADIPEAERPAIYVMRTDSDVFQARLAAAGVSIATDVCDVDPVPAIVEYPVTAEN